MAEKKNQHYVPQFYQRNFSDDGKTTGVFVLGISKYISASPIKNQASADYFYSKNLKIEDAISKLEALANEAIDSVLTNPYNSKFLEREKDALYVFVIIQLGRTLSQTKKLEAAIDALSKETLRKILEKDRVSGRNEYAEITDEVLESVRIGLTEPGLFAVGNFAKIVNLCRDLKCKVIINKTAIPFITSDNPVCLTNQFLDKMKVDTNGLGQRGLQLLMPLSPLVAILYYDSEVYKVGSVSKQYVEITDKVEIEKINRMLASQANEILIIPNGKEKVVNILAYKREYDKFHTNPSVESVSMDTKDGNSAIIGIVSKRDGYKWNPQFIKYRPNYACIKKEHFDERKHLYREIALMERMIQLK
ncbi:MAG: DUF4238 domain-containing protein [Paludibacteraceae bacterium]